MTVKVEMVFSAPLTWTAMFTHYVPRDDSPWEYTPVSVQRQNPDPIVALGTLIKEAGPIIGLSPEVVKVYHSTYRLKSYFVIGAPAHGKNALVRVDTKNYETAYGLWFYQRANVLGFYVNCPIQQDWDRLRSAVIPVINRDFLAMNVGMYGRESLDPEHAENIFLSQFGISS